MSSTLRISYKYIIGLIVAIGIGGGSLFGQTSVFAENTNTTLPATIENCKADAEIPGCAMIKFYRHMDLIIRMAMWLRVIPVMLAGKLMTNDIVYGSAIHLDVYLFQMWNMCKNLANYMVLLVFLYGIFKTLMGESIMQKLLPKLLLSGVLIQASWFISGIIIDMSTIGVTAVSSVAIDLVQSTPRLKTIANASMLNIPKSVTFDKDLNLTATNDLRDAVSLETMMKDMSPSYKSLSGPMLYFGAAVFRMRDGQQLPDSQISIQTMTISTLVQIGLFLMFLVPIIALLVTNFIRVAYLRLWIALSPLIVLIKLFDAELKAMGVSIASEKTFQRDNIIGLVFQPVVMTAAMGIGMFFVINMQSLMTQAHTSKKGPTESFYGGNPAENKLDKKLNYSSSPGSSAIGEDGENPIFTLNGNIVGDAADMLGGGIGYMIMTMLTATVLWMVFKAGTSTSELTKSATSFITDTAFNSFAMAKVPGMGGLSIDAITGIKDPKKSLRGSLMKTPGDILDKYTDADKDYIRDYTRKSTLGKALGLDNIGDISAKFSPNENIITTGYDYNKGDGGRRDEFHQATEKMIRGIQEDIQTADKEKVFSMNLNPFKKVATDWLNKGGAYYLKDKYALNEEVRTKYMTDGKPNIDVFFSDNGPLGDFFNKAINGTKLDGGAKSIGTISGWKGSGGKKVANEVKFNGKL